MTSYYSAVSHFRHPWFDRTIMKRKQPTPMNLNEDMDDEDDSEIRPTKRRRCTGLESGIAHLSLKTTAPNPPITDYTQGPSSAGAGLGPIVEEARGPSPTGTAASSSSGSEASTTSPGGDRHYIVLPGSVEEPSSAPEVEMGASWYEPERDRIVIIDLDAYADEDEAPEDSGLTVEDTDPPSTAGLNVNPIYLQHLLSTSSRNALDKLHQHPQLPPSTSDPGALVLFRPLPFAPAQSSPESELKSEPQQQPPVPASETESKGEDAMDLDDV